MTLDDLAQGEHWMTPDERQNAAELVQSLRQIIAGRPIPENYPLVHCAREFILHHTLCQRLENGLIPDPAAVYPAIDPILAGYIARLHDRVRRILREFQDIADKLDPTPLESGSAMVAVTSSTASASVSASASASVAFALFFRAKTPRTRRSIARWSLVSAMPSIRM